LCAGVEGVGIGFLPDLLGVRRGNLALLRRFCLSALNDLVGVVLGILQQTTDTIAQAEVGVLGLLLQLRDPPSDVIQERMDLVLVVTA
jgi:hypothetical protein